MVVAGGGVVLRDTVHTLRNEVDFLKTEMEKGGRFTAIEGRWHEKRITRIEDSVTRHHQADEGHSGIRRNTPIILDNQTKAHTHLFVKNRIRSVESE